jgi:hypothetical protein
MLNAISKKYMYLGIEVAAAAHYILTSSCSNISTTPFATNILTN